MRTLAVNGLRLADRRTAIGRHIEQLVRRWSKSRVPFSRILVLTPSPTEIEGLGRVTPVDMVQVGSRTPNLLWEQCVLPLAARTASVLYSIYSCPLVHTRRLVVANHGIYERLPDTFTLWQRLRATPIHRMSARRGHAVIANSANTKRDLVEFFDLDPDKITVIHSAPADFFYERQPRSAIRDEVRSIFGEVVPYVLFVGKLSRRRHVPELVEAFARLKSEGCEHRLLVVGPDTSGVDVDALREEHGLGDSLVYRPYLDQSRLPALYAGADVFALPTTYEGHSRTILEAMACGTAVLTVEHPTLAESGGDAVLAVPSASCDDIASGLRTLLREEAVRRDYGERARIRAREFSFEACARKTMAVLDGVAPPND